MPVSTVLFTFSVHFVAAFLHLTDQLLKPKTDFFKFQLQISLIIMIHGLIASIMTSFFISGFSENSDLIFYIQYFSTVFFYLLFALAILNEVIKIRRRLNSN